MDQRVAKMRYVLVTCGVMLIIAVFGIGIYCASISEEQGKLMTEPLNMTSITQKWYCKNGTAFPISKSKIVAVCKGEYVDIRHVIKHKATIKGIQLTLLEWKQLNDIINDVNDIL